MLRGTGLVAVRVAQGAIRIELRAAPPPLAAAPLPDAEIVVTATKRRETLADVPFAMTVISLDQARLADRVAGTADAVALAGDVQLTNLGPGRNRIFIRGIADSAFTGPTQSTVSVYLDDARINFAEPDPDLRLVDVDRVEVLKGPQGTLYGTGALAGIYRIVPRRPVIGAWSGSVAAGFSTVAYGGGGGSAEAVLNAPIGRTMALRVVGYAVRDGGWIDDPGRGIDNGNRAATAGVRAALLAEVADDWNIEAAVAVQSINVRDGQYADQGRGTLRKATVLAEPSDNDFRNLRLVVRGRLGSLDVTSSTSYVDHSVGDRYDASRAAALFALATPLRFDQDQSVGLLTHETRVSNPSRSRPWVAGVALSQARTLLTGTFTTPAGGRVEVQRVRGEVGEAAVFGEATASLAPALDLTGGLRLSITDTQDEATGDAARERRDTKVSLVPMLAARWRPMAGTQVHARIATALRPGGLNPTGMLEKFSSDHLESYEAGGRFATADGRMSVTLDLFAIRWRDIQSDILQPNGLITTANVGTGHNFGGELVLSWRPVPGWHAELGGALQSAELVAGDRREAGLPSVPGATARLAAGRDFDIGAVAVSADATARYVGRSRLSFDPALDRRMGGYAVVDLDLSAAAGSWRLGAGVQNLLDGSGDSFSFGNPFSVRSVRQRVPVRPRTLTLRLARSF